MKIQVFGRLPPDAPRWLTATLEDIANQVNGLSTGSIYSTYNAYTAAPTTGTYAQGDFVKNSAPSGATPTIGWICTAGGTPGTWVAVSVGGGGPGGLSDGDYGDITVSGGASVFTIDNDVVTFAKMQNITDARLLGRSAGSSGDMQELTVGVGLTLASGNLYGSQLETRTSDPGTPFTGQMWLRTDL